jgi:hypothetical protein
VDVTVGREGGCACGAVRYRFASEPLFVQGEPEPVAVPRSGGKRQKIWRCAACQTALYSEYTSPRVRFVRAGTLDDPSSVAPDVHIFTRSKLPWLTLPESVPAFNVYYDTEKLWPEESLARLEALRQSA